MRKTKLWGTISFIALFSLAILWGSWQWFVNRETVPEGHSLVLRYKGPLPIESMFASSKRASPGSFADEAEGEIGIWQTMRGPGRHFYNPVWFERTIVPDVEIPNAHVGIVTCKLGASLPDGEFLVEGDIGETLNKGVLRKVLHPGRYRIHPYAYEVKILATETKTSGNQTKHHGWVEIPTGYVGVVTNLADNPSTGATQGVQENVLPPGLYPINGTEQQIDIVEIGFRETTIAVKNKLNEDGTPSLDEAGEPIIADRESGIDFPSDDGFPINMDYTAIWGLMPYQAPHAVATFGNVDQVDIKVVRPQIESICRTNGSKNKAVQFLVGETREAYQTSTLSDFQAVMEDKDISLLYGLVRHIYIPVEVREPIQKKYVAEEVKQTKEQEKSTAQAKANLAEAEKLIANATATVDAETLEEKERIDKGGTRAAEEKRAETVRLVAAIDKQTAELNAQATELLGKANAEGQQMVEEAKAGRFKLAVAAFGTPEAYNNWVFASGLPEDVKLKMLYAGDGTLWTDLKQMQVILDKTGSK